MGWVEVELGWNESEVYMWMREETEILVYISLVFEHISTAGIDKHLMCKLASVSR